MALTFYYGSGSPFAWKVWLALEHKHVPYELQVLSFDRGDLKKPEFIAVNPRAKVPAIVHDGFALWESEVIVEYLEERFPERPVLPREPRERATARRIAAEADTYLYAAQRRLAAQTLFRPKGDGDAAEIAAAHEGLLTELARFESTLAGDFFAGSLSIADFAVYPFLRAVRRVDEKQPHNGLGDRFTPKLAAWMKRIEALPYYDKTFPPHWKG